MYAESYNNLNVKSQLDEIVEYDFNKHVKKEKTGVVVEKNHHVISSQSGASSADIMYYRFQRAKERAREAEMAAEDRIVRNKEEFESQRLKRLIPLEERNEKKRAKRIRKEKNKKQNKLQYKLTKEAQQVNQFENNGNFMEQFLKLQEEQKKENQETQ